jgi:hypothetical protein
MGEAKIIVFQSPGMSRKIIRFACRRLTGENLPLEVSFLGGERSVDHLLKHVIGG